VNQSQLTNEQQKSRPDRHQPIAGKATNRPPESLENSRPVNCELGVRRHHHLNRNFPIYNFLFLADDR
jgi:hypothetical protein